MNAVTEIKADADPLAKLREPFPAHHVSKLPKESKKQREEREADRTKGVNCTICGGWHHKQAVHLDYVGHAALTDRLLDTDPMWFWEPVAFRDGLPAFDATGGLWIKLTVCGVTRLGYGHAGSRPGMDPGAREKEVIGDALRNAAMRFGAALDLWHKGDLHADSEDAPASDAPPETTPATTKGPSMASLKREGVYQTLQDEMDACKTVAELVAWDKRRVGDIKALPPQWYQALGDRFEVTREKLESEELAAEGEAELDDGFRSTVDAGSRHEGLARGNGQVAA